MRFTKKTVENYFTALKNFCPEIESYSIIDCDGRIGNLITIGIVDKGGCISNTVNFYTPREFVAFLDGIAFLNRITNSSIKRSISWSVNDFKNIAESLSDMYEFDENKFPLALRNMIDKHDANEGINNSVIEKYLINFCQKD